jgi:glycosyltransferase involved in cell wall biosynthesis
MMPRKLRVLIDMSMACRGYCGIAQDVRLLYKTLARCPDLEVTGLIYRPQKFAAPHSFAAPNVSRADALAAQSTFLNGIADSGTPGDFRSVAGLKARTSAIAHTLRARRVRLAPLDARMFAPTLWRQMFRQTLPPEDLELVEQGRFVAADMSDGMVFARGLSGRKPLAIDTQGYDFLIVQGPRPLRTSPGTRHITRYHDMIPVLEPDTMKHPWAIRWHQRAISQSTDSVFVCNSDPTRADLVEVFPELTARAAMIPYTRSDIFRRSELPSLALSVLNQRRSPATHQPASRSLPRYLISVSTLEPRKNFVGLIQAFSQVKSQARIRQRVGRLKLVIVGAPGWKHGPILDAIRPLAASGDLIHLEGVSSEELRVLYSHAESLVFPSHAEGFGFPPLEALQCGTPAIVSDLASHRWVLGDAALYCEPNSVESIVDQIVRLVASEESPALRRLLLAHASRQIERFDIDRCAAVWSDFFQRTAPGSARLDRHDWTEKVRCAA